MTTAVLIYVGAASYEGSDFEALFPEQTLFFVVEKVTAHNEFSMDAVDIQWLKDRQIKTLVVCASSFSRDTLWQHVLQFKACKLKYQFLDWNQNPFQIHPLTVSDLFEEPEALPATVFGFYKDQTVLVTGSGGSIGQVW